MNVHDPDSRGPHSVVVPRPVGEAALSTVLVGVDASEHAREALAEACRIVAANPAAELHILRVVPHPIGDVGPYGPMPDIVSELATVIHQARRELQEECDRFAPDVAARAHQHVRTGAPSKELVALAAEIDADLIVIGTGEQSGLERLLLGSIAASVQRHAPCSVLTVRQKPPVPAIEDGCLDCLDARAEAGDGDARCARHRHRLRPHTYHESAEPAYPGPSFRF